MLLKKWAWAIKLSEGFKGAFLHDAGKIGIRDNILLKPGKLTDKEFVIMKKNVDHGVEIVNRPDWLSDADDDDPSHHERFDGNGYPEQTEGEAIPVTARIFEVVDVFDALTSKRPYKEPIEYGDSMSILEKGRGNHFDPVVLDHFKTISREIYDQFKQMNLQQLMDELQEIIKRYFEDKIEDLR